MQKMIIPITTINDQSKMLQITTKTSSLKKRYVKTWTSQQDQILLSLYQTYPKKWNLISNNMKNRNQNQCLHRFRRISKLGQNKKIWSNKEDQTVIQMINQIGHNWRLIAQQLGTKTGKQIRQRFINKLDPTIRRQQWTQEEDMKIIQLFSQMGSKWCQISKYLPGRPQNRIKNRFYSYIQKNYDFKVKEDVVATQCVQDKQNSHRVAGIRCILQKSMSHFSESKKSTGSGRILQQRRQNSQQQREKNEMIKQQLNQECMNDEGEMRQQKQNNYNGNSMKQINDQCFFKYNYSQVNNNDLLYFEDN